MLSIPNPTYGLKRIIDRIYRMNMTFYAYGAKKGYFFNLVNPVNPV